MQISDYDNLLWLESVLVVETLLHQSVGSFPKESQKRIEGDSNNSMHHYYKHCIFYTNGSSSTTIKHIQMSRFITTKILFDGPNLSKNISISKINLYSRFTGNSIS